MGVVFKAHDPEMGRDVAIKVLKLDESLGEAEREEVSRRFEREAKAAGGMNHPNIVSHYERGQLGQHKYIVMDLVEGRSLHQIMSQGPRPDARAAVDILRQMASALDYAHGRGVVHRDIKPGNVLVQTDGRAKIADFGIAKYATPGSTTSTSVVLGSPHYMAPEQIEAKGVTGRSDQWALAVTAFELLAGRKPFESESVASLFHKILAAPLTDPSTLDPSLAPVKPALEKALSKNPEERFATCTEFIAAMEVALFGAAQPGVVFTPSRPKVKIKVRKSLLLVAALGLGVMVLSAWVIIHFALAPQKPVQTASPAATRASSAVVHNAGETRLNRRDGETYVWVAPGHFRMGCSPGDSDCHEDEQAHEVTLTKGYWIAQTEASTAAYRRFSRAVGRDMPKAPDFNPNWSNDQMPVTGISWDDADTFCRWALGRLPTEAEWEFAARAGSPELRYGPLDEVAWHKANSGSKAHPVKGRQPNAFGLYDMLGNMWEWTADRYNKDAYLSGPRTDPQGPPTGNFHILRGGSWLRDATEVRVSGRYPVTGDNPDHVIGFRCAADDLP